MHTNPANQLELFLTNANGLRNKHTELEALLQAHSVKIACITETWWNPDILEAETQIPNYSVIRNDRKDKSRKEGGGVCFYVHDLVQTLPAPDLQIEGCAFLRIKNTVLILVYHSTSYSLSETKSLVTALDEKITKIIEGEESVILLGDFNLPDLNWDEAVINSPTDTTDSKFLRQQLFLDLFLNHDLAWNHGNSFVTRRRKHGDILRESTLDNILTSDEALLSPSRSVAKLGKSDHIGILCTIALSHNLYTTKSKKLWHKYPPEDIVKNAENLDWKVSGSSQDMWDKIHTNLLRICEDVPTKSVNSDSGNFENKSARPAVIRARKNKDKMWKIFDTDPTAINLAIAEHADAKLARIIFEDLTATKKRLLKISARFPNHSTPISIEKNSRRPP